MTPDSQVYYGDHKIVIPYEWVDRRGQAVLEGWDLEKRQMRQLKVLLLRIEDTDYEVANGSLIFKKGGAEGLYYIKVNGNEALRPRCCLGPELDRAELRRAGLEANIPEKKSILTFLERVTKKDGVEAPPMKSSKCRERVALIEEDRQNRKAVKMHHQGGPT